MILQEQQHEEVPADRLAAVCGRALQLAARAAPGLPARLSLLGDKLLMPGGERGNHYTLPRRLIARETHGHADVFPARLLSGLRLQRRTLGHLSAVYCVVVDCTGRYVATGADDLLVKLWCALDGRPLMTLRGASAEITDLCVSDDVRLVAAGSVDRCVRVWSLRTGAPVAVLQGHAGTVTAVHWRPAAAERGAWLASTSTDGSVAFWAMAGGGFLQRPVQFAERTRPGAGACRMVCAAWSPGGALLAAGSGDHRVRLYALAGGAPRRVLEAAAHEDAVDSLCWARRELRFVSGSKDGTAALWQLHAAVWRHATLHANRTDTPQDRQRRLKVLLYMLLFIKRCHHNLCS